MSNRVDIYGAIMIEDKIKIDCKEMITEILDDGDKLRSLNQLMDHYELKFPFAAYKARGVGKGMVFVLLEFVTNGQILKTPCSVCGGGIISNQESIFVSGEIHHMRCRKGGIKRVGGGGWDPDAENWKLA